MSIRFGTDGVRGLANAGVSPELALALGAATASVFDADQVVIGRDTRRSGPMLEAAAAAGVAASGARAVLVGVVATPAVALASAQLEAPGIVISASHNAFADNGLKVFAPGGRKLTDDQQSQVEAALAAVLGAEPAALSRPTGAGVGTIETTDVADAYAQHVIDALDGRDLDGMHVVLDCANGANSAVAPAVFERLGATVEVLAAAPDGTNINERCGSTDPTELSAAVVRLGADLGIAFDGDADRMVAVGPDGSIVSGDHTLVLFAEDLRARGRLHDDTLVVTVMSNLGLHRALAEAGISVVTTPVGDRSVLEALDTGGWSLGGEQSGHIVFSDLATTGDGLLAGVLLADLVRRAGRPLDELAGAAMTHVPQVLLNVAIATPMPDVTDRIVEALAAATSELGADGRVLVRPSGTEPVVRVMVEAIDASVADDVAQRLAEAVRSVSTD
jgi:phosphoglucosamine mutase